MQFCVWSSLFQKPRPVEKEWGRRYQFVIRVSSEEGSAVTLQHKIKQQKAWKLIIILNLNMHSPEKCNLFIVNYLHNEPVEHVTNTRILLL